MRAIISFRKNKKSASNPSRRFFRREGKLIALTRARVCQRNRLNVYTATLPIKSHRAIYQGENSIIPAKPDIFTGQKFCAALPDNDAPGEDCLAAELFDPQSFADAVATVLYAPLTFLMSHANPPT
jgi:hypothetical protein